MTRLLAALMLLPLINRGASDDYANVLPGGGKPLKVSASVLFRSTGCADTNGVVCSGNGICGTSYNPTSVEDIIACKCYDGFTGPDCSIRYCPSNTAWADMPYANDTAHKPFQECSNFGYCNRITGTCICRAGYTGHACERMSCPSGGPRGSSCSGHGHCLNIKEAGESEMYLGNRADAFDGTVRLESTTAYRLGPKDWDDSLRVQGCVCEPGWEGHDCSLRSCPVGDDPMTSNQTDDSQLIDCSCYAGVACAGTFRLKFRGQSTVPIPFNATVDFLKFWLEKLSTISAGGLLVDNVDSAKEPPTRYLCSGLGETTRVTFLKEHGPLPALEPVQADSSLDLQVAAGGNASYFYPWIKSAAGSKEEARCSGRGTCDRRDALFRGAGLCACFDAFKASDSRGLPGLEPDCGHFDDKSGRSSFYAINAKNASNFGCPVTQALHKSERLLCSGVGKNCSAATDFKCNCTAGFTGPGCEYRDCPSSRSWFSEPHPVTGRAHLKGYKCSNGGSCDEATGQCICQSDLFDGAACHTMPCPFNNSEECGGRGKCWTLNKLARYALSPLGLKLNISYQLPWDAFKSRTCNCGRPLSVDSQVMTYRDLDRPYLQPTETEIVYRGPYAYQSTDGLGYDCSKMRCPTGDDVFTPGVNEVQEVRCVATGGAFKMFWREAVSPDITFDMGELEIRQAFEDMTSISKVDITFGRDNKGENASKACGSDGNHSFFVEFKTEFGSLPLLEPIVRNGDNSFRLYRDDECIGDRPRTGACSESGIVQVFRYQKSTKENLECGRQGICNEDTGFCHCMAGLVSGGGTHAAGHDSFGTNAYGHRGDCGFRHTDTRAFNTETRYVGVDPGGRFGEA